MVHLNSDVLVTLPLLHLHTDYFSKYKTATGIDTLTNN